MKVVVEQLRASVKEATERQDKESGRGEAHAG
jgi:hypothetical protein